MYVTRCASLRTAGFRADTDFIYLKLTEPFLWERVSQRKSHYMKSDMVQSQLAALEEPQSEWDAITINVEGSQEQVQLNVLEAVADKLQEYS